MMSIAKGKRRLWHCFFKYTQEHWNNSCIQSTWLDWIYSSDSIIIKR